MPLNISGLSNYISASRAGPEAAATLASRNLRRDVERLGTERAGMAPQRTRNIGQIGNAENRLKRSLGGQASSTLAQGEGALPVSFRGALDQATRRMRARQGIVNRGDAAIRNQTLRDRIEVARGSASRRGSLQNALQSAANIREGVNVGISNANQRIAESRANMFGTLAGAATSYLKNRPPSEGFAGLGEGVTQQTVDQGTAIADARPPTEVYS